LLLFQAFFIFCRSQLQTRAVLLPYIYNGHRAAFDTGLGLLRPMYYPFPELDAAYAMDDHGNSVQYMFGPSILFSPVVTPGDTKQQAMGPGLASKTTWLPPGSWFDACSGVITTVAPADGTHFVTKNYSIAEVPTFYVAGDVVPYVPIRSLPVLVGNAGRQYTFLGFKVVPGAGSGSVSVYEVRDLLQQGGDCDSEWRGVGRNGGICCFLAMLISLASQDDGTTTAYLTDNVYAWTTGAYTLSTDGTSATFTVTTNGSFPELPASRAYQLRFLNSPPITGVMANGVQITYNRFGRMDSTRKFPAASQYYWDYSLQVRHLSMR
jgi:hypothetical protein